MTESFGLTAPRARRRHHVERMKAKARRIRPTKPDTVKDADHLAVCSCWMCGNPRIYLKGADRFTMQELRANLAERDRS